MLVATLEELHKICRIADTGSCSPNLAVCKGPVINNVRGGGGAVGDKYQILNFFRAAPDRKTFIFKTPPPSSRKFRTPPTATFNSLHCLV